MNDNNKKKVFKKNFKDLKNTNPNLSDYKIEKLAEHISCTNLLYEKKEIEAWFREVKSSFKSSVTEVPINNLSRWNSDNAGDIKHESGKFFSIVGVRIGKNAEREIGNDGWDQPIVKEFNYDGGLLGLLRTKIDSLPHYLVQARFEPGNYGLIQIGPTLQATFSNFTQAHGGRKPYYSDFFEDYKTKKNYQFNSWLAEDGGKFLKKRNLGLVKNVDISNIKIINENYKWMSLFQINDLLHSNSIINPHLARLIFL